MVGTWGGEGVRAARGIFFSMRSAGVLTKASCRDLKSVWTSPRPRSARSCSTLSKHGGMAVRVEMKTISLC